MVACLGAHIEHRDRELGLAVLSALAASRVDASPLAASLDRTLREDSQHAASCLAALAAAEPAPLLERAIRDELELLRQRVLALLAVWHGAETIHPVALGLAGGGEGRRSLAIEMLEVTLGRAEATLALPIVRTDLPDNDRLRSLGSAGAGASADRAATLADLMEDEEGRWRSPWLQACAVYEARSGGEALPVRRLATEATDPVLRETLEWAAGRAETI